MKDKTFGNIEYRLGQFPRKPQEGKIQLSCAIVDAESGERYPFPVSFPFVIIPKGSAYAKPDTTEGEQQAVLVKAIENKVPSEKKESPGVPADSSVRKYPAKKKSQ
ncbi:MAG: hypothetical protein IPM82_07455 [Saprospiraceae bacterium]|nr:hypothetical protein [Saprospiraceae bacterium]